MTDHLYCVTSRLLQYFWKELDSTRIDFFPLRKQQLRSQSSSLLNLIFFFLTKRGCKWSVFEIQFFWTKPPSFFSTSAVCIGNDNLFEKSHLAIASNVLYISFVCITDEHKTTEFSILQSRRANETVAFRSLFLSLLIRANLKSLTDAVCIVGWTSQLWPLIELKPLSSTFSWWSLVFNNLHW